MIRKEALTAIILLILQIGSLVVVRFIVKPRAEQQKGASSVLVGSIGGLVVVSLSTLVMIQKGDCMKRTICLIIAFTLLGLVLGLVLTVVVYGRGYGYWQLIFWQGIFAYTPRGLFLQRRAQRSS